MTRVVQFILALLIGYIAGAGSVVYLLHSGAGVAFLRATEPVQDLEHRLRDVETQRDLLTRQLEDVSARASRMESSFTELEKRFHEMEREPRPAP